MTFTVGSLFSGVGGFELGFERAGFDVRWQCEIDPDATSVLERHWPGVRRYRDVTDVDPSDLEPVDVLIFGSPCQGFSVAGRGAGLDDERSGLFGEAIRVIRGLRPALAVWENVPGAYSANDGRDFGAVLAALAESGALDVAWRVLDAQWFGVPQRRRRIFLVADFGAERAVQVLFEPEGGAGDLEACGEAGQGTADDVEDGAGIVSIQYGSRVRPNYGGHVTVGGPSYTVDTFGEHADGVLPAAVSGTLTAAMRNGHNGQDDHTPGFMIPVAGHGVGQTGNMLPAVFHGIDWQQDGGSVEDGTPCLSTTRVPAVSGHAQMAVRRLTPRECERLQGWPDDHTRWRADGREISDGPRYRMIGNGVATPVAEWIARRMRAALEGA